MYATPSFQYQVGTEPVLARPETVTESRWHMPWSTPVRVRVISAALIAASGVYYAPGILSGEVVTEDKWHFAWSEPVVKSKIGLKPGSQQFLALAPNPVVSFAWMAQLADPVRIKPQIPAGEQQFFAYQPTPIIDIGWYNWLTDPVRTRTFAAAQQLGYAFGTFSPIIPGVDGWWRQYADPVRVPAALRVASQMAFTYGPVPVPSSATWWKPFGEPVRTRTFLITSGQQFLAWGVFTPPTRALLGVMSAIETKDIFLGAAMSWNQATSAEVGVIDTSVNFSTEIGVIPSNATGSIASVSISISLV